MWVEGIVLRIATSPHPGHLFKLWKSNWSIAQFAPSASAFCNILLHQRPALLQYIWGDCLHQAGTIKLQDTPINAVNFNCVANRSVLAKSRLQQLLQFVFFLAQSSVTEWSSTCMITLLPPFSIPLVPIILAQVVLSVCNVARGGAWFGSELLLAFDDLPQFPKVRTVWNIAKPTLMHYTYQCHEKATSKTSHWAMPSSTVNIRQLQMRTPCKSTVHISTDVLVPSRHLRRVFHPEPVTKPRCVSVGRYHWCCCKVRANLWAIRGQSSTPRDECTLHWATFKNILTISISIYYIIYYIYIYIYWRLWNSDFMKLHDFALLLTHLVRCQTRPRQFEFELPLLRRSPDTCANNPIRDSRHDWKAGTETGNCETIKRKWCSDTVLHIIDKCTIFINIHQ